METLMAEEMDSAQQTTCFVRIVAQDPNSLYRATQHMEKCGFSTISVALTTHPMNRAYALRYRKPRLDGNPLQAIKLRYTLSPSAIEDFRKAVQRLSKDMQVEIHEVPEWDLAPAWPQ
jgi:hypothetical protein